MSDLEHLLTEINHTIWLIEGHKRYITTVVRNKEGIIQPFRVERLQELANELLDHFKALDEFKDQDEMTLNDYLYRFEDQQKA